MSQQDSASLNFRVDNEKIESLKSYFFGVSHCLTIEMKCRIGTGSISIAFSVLEIASGLETQLCQKWEGLDQSDFQGPSEKFLGPIGSY